MLEDKDLLSIQEARAKVGKAYSAWLKYCTYSQERVDAVVERMAAAARAYSARLAEAAVEETGYGNARDKYVKNILAADWLPRRMRGLRTVGVLRELPEEKIVEIGVPMGVVAAILPVTNPTSTAIYNILIALKAGNAIVLSPHPRAYRCTCQTASLLHQAALEAGAPEGIIQCVENTTLAATDALMRHERTGVILATGGTSMVKAAYSSGKPALGVSPGNVPVLVDTSADLEDAIAKIVIGKAFDYGILCSTEQALVAEETLRGRILDLLRAHKARIATDAQRDALGKLLFLPGGNVNPRIIGQSAAKLASLAGFAVPPDTSILCAEVGGVGPQHPLSGEKFTPILALYFTRDFNAAMETCEALLRFGGLGHSAAIYSRNEARTREYALRVPAMRVLVNTPAPQGAAGITTSLFPAVTLGCGAAAGSSTSDNIGPRNLIDIKRLAYAVRRPEEAFEMPMDYRKAPSAEPTEEAMGVSRSAVAAAVEHYLATRGVSVRPAAQANGQPVRAVAVANAAADVVDRFLAARSVTVQAAGQPNGSPDSEALVSRVAGAVDKFLAARGGAAQSPAQPNGRPVKVTVVPNVTDVVDRFLAARGAAAQADPVPAAPPVKASVIPHIADTVVEQFLLGRSAGPASGFG